VPTKRQNHTIPTYRDILGFFERTAHLMSPEIRVIVKRFDATVQEIHQLRAITPVIRVNARLKTLEVPLATMREEQMLPLSRMARRVFAGESAILAAIRVPHKKASSDVMINAALRMVEALTPHRRTLKEASIDPARLTRLKAEAKSLQKLVGKTKALIADRGVPTRRLEELFSSAHMDVMSLQALVKASRIMTPEQKFDFAGYSRIGKMLGRPSKVRQQNAAQRKARNDPT